MSCSKLSMVASETYRWLTYLLKWKLILKLNNIYESRLQTVVTSVSITLMHTETRLFFLWTTYSWPGHLKFVGLFLLGFVCLFVCFWSEKTLILKNSQMSVIPTEDPMALKKKKATNSLLWYVTRVFYLFCITMAFFSAVNIIPAYFSFGYYITFLSFPL